MRFKFEEDWGMKQGHRHWGEGGKSTSAISPPLTPFSAAEFFSK